MATMKRISIQMPGGQPELSPTGRAKSSKKQSPSYPTRMGQSRLTMSNKSNKSSNSGSPGLQAVPPMTPLSDGSRMTRIYYYKYADPQSSPGGEGGTSAKKFYLSTATCALDSQPKSAGRVEATASVASSSARREAAPAKRKSSASVRKAPPKWSSASADHNLLTMDYHLSELSLHYRSPAEAVSSRSGVFMRDEDDREMEDFTEDVIGEEEIGSPPPPPSSTVPSPRESAVPLNAGGSATTSSCPIPDPEEFVQKSSSNRLLNVISIDECHVKHRRARRRVRSSKHDRPPTSAFNSVDAERLMIPDDTADCPSLDDAGSMGSLLEPRNTMLDRIERLHGFRSMPLTMGAGSRAQQLFARRNQLLREHMNVYVAWRTSERLKERFEKMRGLRSAHGVLEANKEERLKAFSAVLRSKEVEFAQRSEATEEEEVGKVDDYEEETMDSDDYKEALNYDEDDEQNKLTRMWEVLQ